MSPTIKELTNQVMALAPDERALLAHRLWDSLADFADPEVEQAWLAEAERRWHEIEEGTVRCVSAEEAMARARAGLKEHL